MKIRLLAAGATAALLVGGTPLLAATILTDNLDDEQRVEDAPGIGNQFGPSGNIIGGYRDLLAQNDAKQNGATELGALNGSAIANTLSD